MAPAWGLGGWFGLLGVALLLLPPGLWPRKSLPLHLFEGTARPKPQSPQHSNVSVFPPSIAIRCLSRVFHELREAFPIDDSAWVPGLHFCEGSNPGGSPVSNKKPALKDFSCRAANMAALVTMFSPYFEVLSACCQFYHNAFVIETSFL